MHSDGLDGLSDFCGHFCIRCEFDYLSVPFCNPS